MPAGRSDDFTATLDAVGPVEPVVVPDPPHAATTRSAMTIASERMIIEEG